MDNPYKALLERYKPEPNTYDDRWSMMVRQVYLFDGCIESVERAKANVVNSRSVVEDRIDDLQTELKHKRSMLAITQGTSKNSLVDRLKRECGQIERKLSNRQEIVAFNEGIAQTQLKEATSKLNLQRAKLNKLFGVK